jgi:RNA exonuclease 4
VKAATAPETNGFKKKPKVTRCVAIDCEMVGVGEDGKDSILARVSLVNQHNECIYDKFVQPTERVTDYRTSVSGVRPDDLKEENGAVAFEVAQKEVAALLKKKILVGHAVQNDLKILFLSHERRKIRDTQKCKVFRKINPSLGGLTSLKNLAKTLLGITIQEGEHSSVQDAQAAMRLYTMFKKEWELDLQSKKASKKKKSDEEVDDESAAKKVDVVNKHQRYIENKLKRRNKNKHFKNKK